MPQGAIACRRGAGAEGREKALVVEDRIDLSELRRQLAQLRRHTAASGTDLSKVSLASRTDDSKGGEI
jgi:hypothetical protein